MRLRVVIQTNLRRGKPQRDRQTLVDTEITRMSKEAARPEIIDFEKEREIQKINQILRTLPSPVLVYIEHGLKAIQESAQQDVFQNHLSRDHFELFV